MKAQDSPQFNNLLHNTLHLILVLAVIILAVAVSFNVFTTTKTAGKNSEGTNTNTGIISVSGSAEKNVEPDEAVINFQVTTENQNSKQAQRENTEIGNRMDSIAKNLNGKLETTGYNIYPNIDYRTNKILGYKVVHSFKATLKTENAGEYLSAIVQAGIKNINGISFKVNDEKYKEIRESLLEEAGKEARKKAETLASSVGEKIKGIERISESGDYYPYPVPYRGVDVAVSEFKAETPPEIEAGKITIKATVNVDFKI